MPRHQWDAVYMAVAVPVSVVPACHHWFVCWHLIPVLVLQVTWRAKKSDASNGGYSQALLEGLFSRYGPLHHVLVSGKRKGKALVSFHSSLDAVSTHTHTHTHTHTIFLMPLSFSKWQWRGRLACRHAR